MTPRTLLFAASASLIIAASVVRTDPSLECSFVESSQVEIGDCVAEIEFRANAAMELVLGYARDKAFDLDETTGRESALPALDSAQAAWSAFRDAHCAFRGTTYGGGSGTGIAISACRVEVTRARTTELYKYID